MTNTIREAIRVIAEVGWTKDAFADEQGRHCLQGALYEAHGLCPFDQRQVGVPVRGEMASDLRLVNEVVTAQFPERAASIGVSRFNDHPDTTLEEVIQVLEKAALCRDERI